MKCPTCQEHPAQRGFDKEWAPEQVVPCPHPSHALAAAVVDAAVAMEVAFGEWRNAYMAKDAPHDTDEYLRVSDAATEAKHDFADAVRALLASLDRELGA